jgi:hypothetical protein
MKRPLVLLLLFFSFLMSLKAQQTSPELLDYLVKKNILTAGQADSLANVEKKRPAPKVFYLLDKVKVYGYAQLDYQYSGKDSVTDSFGVKRAITFIDGKITGNSGFIVQANLGPNPQFIEFYLDWNPCTYFNVRVGQMKVPFTIENLISQSVLENISGSQMCNALSGGTTDVIGSQGGRDQGAEVTGSLLKNGNMALIDYKAGIYNGNGINNATDNNRHKDIALWLMLHLSGMWAVQGSVYTGEGHYKSAGMADASASDHRRNRWSVGTVVETACLYVRAEYAAGNDGSIARRGGYVLINGHLPGKIDLIAQYDNFNQNTTDGYASDVRYQLGLNWNFAGRSRVMCHYVRAVDHDLSYNQILARLQVGF